MLSQTTIPVIATSSAPFESQAGRPQLDVRIFSESGPALGHLDAMPLVGIVPICHALEIDPEPEVDRLAAVRWSGLTSIVDPKTGESAIALPWPAARLWLLSLDSRRIAARSRRWLEDLQADAVEMLWDLPPE